MTEDMFGLNIPLTPYPKFCPDSQFAKPLIAQRLNIPEDNPYLLWLGVALDELRLKRYWHLVAYCDDPDTPAWTLFYHRKRVQPNLIFPRHREIAFREGIISPAGFRVALNRLPCVGGRYDSRNPV